MCQLLMDEKHAEGWQVCCQLGECSKFDDLQFRSVVYHLVVEAEAVNGFGCYRRELFAFALSHCPDDQIETLLRASGVLEVQVLCLDIQA